MPKKILVVFHNGLNYVYYVIIKELPNKIEGKFNCLGENNEKYKTCSVLNNKKVETNNKNGKEFKKSISYKLLQYKIAKKYCNIKLPKTV